MSIFSERAKTLFLKTNIAPLFPPQGAMVRTPQWKLNFSISSRLKNCSLESLGERFFEVLKPFAGNEMSKGTPLNVGQVHENL